MKAGLVWGSLALLIGAATWLLFQVGSTSPTVATIPRSSPLPTSTPDGRIDTLVILVQNIQPTNTATPRPKITPRPSYTPLVHCPTITTEGIPCNPQSPTPTNTPRPTLVPTYPPEPCSTAIARANGGALPDTCYSDREGE